MRLSTRTRSATLSMLPLILLWGISTFGLSGCSVWSNGLVTDSESIQVLGIGTANNAKQARDSIVQQRANIVFQSLAPSTGTQPEIAPFFGNLSVISAPNGDDVAVYRRADCSLTFVNYLLNATSTMLTPTIKSVVPSYERTIHNNAFLTTTPGLFPTGCVDANQGTMSRIVLNMGIGKNGQRLGATIGNPGIFTAGLNSNFTFTAPTQQTTDAFASSLVDGDLNKDGNADVVTINTTGLRSSVSVYLGNNDGSYQPEIVYPLPGGSAQYGVLDDLNGDGILDLLASSDIPTFTFSIFIGKGDGTFNAPQSFVPAATAPSLTSGTAFITADVNGDGVKDIITSLGQIYFGHVDSNHVVTYTLAPQAAFPPIVTGTNPYAPSMVAADFNKDGKMDLATNDGTTIRTYQGIGDGTFTTGPAYATIPNRSFLVATDLDGDGNIDLISGFGENGSYGGDDFITNLSYTLMGNGDGTFQGAPVLPISNTGTNMADLNGDGRPDLIGPSPTASTLTFITELAQANGIFKPGPQLVPPVNSGVDSYALGDFNGDHKVDLIYLNTDPNTPGYYLALGNGDGTFQPPTFTAAPSLEPSGDIDVNQVLTGIAVADFNHDGNLDLIYNFTDTSFNTHIITEGIAVQLGNGNGTFQAPKITTTYSSLTPPTIFFGGMIGGIADINKDTFPDVFLVVPTQTIANFEAQHQVQLFVGKGDGSFNPPTNLTLTPNMRSASSSPNAGFPIAVADLNGDGNMDLVASGSSADGTTPELAIALGNGTGTFPAPTVLAISGFGYAGSPAIADFNGDGKLDVFINALQGTGAGILPGNGDGTLQTIANGNGTISAPQSVVLSLLGAATAVDLNGDGKQDLVVGNVLLLNETGVLVTPPTLAATTTVVTSSANPSTVGQSVTFTATVTGNGGTPTNTVTFLDGSTSLGTGMLSVGTATFTTTTLAVGPHSITASYGGDATFAASTSAVLTQTVNAASVANFAVSASPSNATVSAGQGTAFTLTIMPSGGSTQVVTISCTGAPAQSTCVPAQTSVTLNGTTATQVQVNITTTSRGIAFPSNSRRRYSPPAPLALLAISLSWLAAIYGLRLFAGKTVRPSYVLAAWIFALVAIGGCGSYSGGSGGTTTGTPAGAYTLTLTGTSGSLSHPTTVTLNVN